MISPSTLAAFSNGITSATAAAATRVSAAPVREKTPDAAQKALQSLAPGASPARNTPRGSLLDLSV
jgi:hypothetical protein